MKHTTVWELTRHSGRTGAAERTPRWLAWCGCCSAVGRSRSALPWPDVATVADHVGVTHLVVTRHALVRQVLADPETFRPDNALDAVTPIPVAALRVLAGHGSGCRRPWPTTAGRATRRSGRSSPTRCTRTGSPHSGPG